MTTFVPIDLVKLRKTQRRVAALLGDVTKPDLFLAFVRTTSLNVFYIQKCKKKTNFA